jgi:Transglycosylase SLT domain
VPPGGGAGLAVAHGALSLRQKAGNKTGGHPEPSLPSPGAGPAIPPSSSPWNAGFGIDPLTAAEIERFSTVSGSIGQPPAFLIPIYKAAGRKYDIPWQILAAINAIETDYGLDLAVSPKGAIGWMQFMPATWIEYGVDVSGYGRPNPYDPRDAIFSAARLLAGNGGGQNLPRAIFAYNHALWYVDAVLWRAQIISDIWNAHGDTSLAGRGSTGLAGAETLLAAAQSALGGPYSQANHDSFGQTSAELRRFGTDCSGFVSWLLDQVDPGFGNQTTVTLPDQPGIRPGPGQYVTMWDRALPGDQGHVIIDILGNWFESGGNSANNPFGGIGQLNETQAVGELSGGGFVPFYLGGLQ